MEKSSCISCGSVFVFSKHHSRGKYCSNKCQSTYQYKERTRQWLEEGKDWKQGSPAWVKKYLKEQRGVGCELCGITEWNGKHIVLEMDHKDGCHKNNVPQNLRLICPNCHSQTSTYKAKNKGNGRKYRSLV